MITFVSLFLGLVLGEQTIELAVGDEVAAVELRLDDRELATLRGKPWSVKHDFGSRLLPHELVAIARNQEGEELERIQQWINMPRRPAEAGMVLETDPDGSSRIRLTWKSLYGNQPTSVTASMDGTPLEVTDPKSIPLPPYDPKQLHFFRAELVFSEQVSSVVEATFGGTYADTIQSELTAVPMVHDGRKPPEPAELQGRLLSGDDPLEVVAVERGVAEVLFVLDLSAEAELNEVFRQAARRPNSRWVSPLRKDQRLRIVRSFQRMGVVGDGYDLFPSSPSVSNKEGGVLWLLSRLRFFKEGEVRQRLADVVAAAGTSAASNPYRRAVVLILGKSPEDLSKISPEVARDYLEALQVPLEVWSLERKPGPDAQRWGEITNVSNFPRFQRAVQNLGQELDRQVITWVSGNHLPSSLQLTEADGPVRLVR